MQQTPLLQYYLRILLISLVLAQHLAITCGAVGSWYYHDPAEDLFTTTLLSIFTVTGPTFGMGLFFLLNGYFTPDSYVRKGAGSFLRDRLVRLGIPLLLYDLVMEPLVVYIAGGLRGSYWSFYGDYLLHMRTLGSGPAWFIEVLLLFTLFYSVWRGLTRNRLHVSARFGKRPSDRAIYLFIFALSFVSFVVHVWWPLGWWFQLFNLQVAYVPQYISLYILGLVVYRRSWFFECSARMGRD